MSETNGDPSVASGRSRRQRRENTGRSAALDKIRSGKKNKVEIEEGAERVYDVVDEKEYSRLVQDRLEDDWIVDDGGGEGYVEDGREIFDDDIVDDGTQRSAARGKSASRVRDPARPKKSNIRDMLLSMPSKKTKRDVKLDEDKDLQDILQSIKASPAIGVRPTQLKRKPLPAAPLAGRSPLTSATVRPSTSVKPKLARTLSTTAAIKTETMPTAANPSARDGDLPPSQRIDDSPATQPTDPAKAEQEALEALIQDDDSMFESLDIPAEDNEVDTADVTGAETKPKS